MCENATETFGGFADAVDADHTGTLSIQLSPGVTLDNPFGFLTETNEPGVATPEPSSVASAALGLGLIVVRTRKQQTRRG